MLAVRLQRLPWAFTGYYQPDAVRDGTGEEMCISVCAAVSITAERRSNFTYIYIFFFSQPNLSFPT